MKKQFNLKSIPFSIMMISLFILMGIDVSFAAEVNPATNSMDFTFYIWILIGLSLAVLGFTFKSKS